MAGLKVFLALCCVVAAVNAVQLERKPFKRLIPADVLRGESIQFILEYQTCGGVGLMSFGSLGCS